MTKFMGFPRPDGAVGIRNHVILLGLGLSGVSICHRVAGLVKETIPILHNQGNGISLSEMVRHPNVAGIVVVADGLDKETIGNFISDLERTGKPHDVINLESLGSIEAITKTTLTAVEIIRDVSTQRRELYRFSKLLLGLIYVPGKLMTGVLSGFVQIVMEENGRCLWVEKESKSKAKLSWDIRENLVGYLKAGQTPGPDAGIYRYTGPKNENAIWKSMFASGAQLMVFSVKTGRRMAHPLIPGVDFIVDQNIGSSDICDLDLSKAMNGQLTVKDAGLLLLSQVLSTASGKFTRDEILRGVVIAT